MSANLCPFKAFLILERAENRELLTYHAQGHFHGESTC
jgi:hypothetical protein